ncbi:hypothetical protein VTK73DRAFT_4889 [Phialemonium thermophilum]|uniref:Uncharacterized protein n=1 Tax=Phialemonium thermophilum TaxID=223376 RepID=A0ABR3WRN9_9PEZI
MPAALDAVGSAGGSVNDVANSGLSPSHKIILIVVICVVTALVLAFIVIRKLRAIKIEKKEERNDHFYQPRLESGYSSLLGKGDGPYPDVSVVAVASPCGGDWQSRDGNSRPINPSPRVQQHHIRPPGDEQPQLVNSAAVTAALSPRAPAATRPRRTSI